MQVAVGWRSCTCICIYAILFTLGRRTCACYMHEFLHLVDVDFKITASQPNRFALSCAACAPQIGNMESSSSSIEAYLLSHLQQFGARLISSLLVYSSDLFFSPSFFLRARSLRPDGSEGLPCFDRKERMREKEKSV